MPTANIFFEEYDEEKPSLVIEMPLRMWIAEYESPRPSEQELTSPKKMYAKYYQRKSSNAAYMNDYILSLLLKGAATEEKE